MPHAAAATNAISARSASRVLVVEDRDDTRRHIVEILRSRHYHVDEAADGLNALKKVSAAPYDAIVLDLVLPNVDGWEFRQTLQRHPELARIPTVVVTVRALTDGDRYALGTTEVIQKPFADATLLEAVRKACEIVQAPVPEQPANPTQLYWSIRGEIACWAHAPSTDAHRWQAEKWRIIPPTISTRVVYQCQYCPGNQSAVGHRRRPGPELDRD